MKTEDGQMKHLDEDALKAIERGDPATRAWFAEHLVQPCEVCEAFLAKSAALDGEADSALLSRFANANAPLDEVGFQRVRRGLRQRRLRALPAVVGALAAAVLAVTSVAVWQQMKPPVVIDDGIKGTSATLTVELEAAHQDASGALQRVDKGARLPNSGALILRYYATDAGSALLLQERDGRFEVLGTFALEPGRHPLQLEDGAAAALPLDEEAGAFRLWLVARRGPNAPTLDEARAAVSDRTSGSLASTHIDVEVGPTPR